MLTEPTFRRQGRLAAAGRGGDRLAPFVVGHIPGAIDPPKAGGRGARLGEQVAIGIKLQLAAQ